MRRCWTTGRLLRVMTPLVRGPRWPTAALILTGLATSACLFVVAAVLRARNLQDAANVAQLVSIPIALAPMVVAVAGWWRDRNRPIPISGQDLDDAHET